MIRLESVLTPARSVVNAPGSSKKRVLESIAALFAKEQPELDEHDLFEALINRERLGSTGFGNGIAIPHCRFSGLKSPLSAVLCLEQPVDFDALDGEPVDLLFVLIVPEAATDAHLELLRQVASVLEHENTRQQLRSARDSLALYEAIIAAQNQS